MRIERVRVLINRDRTKGLILRNASEEETLLAASECLDLDFSVEPAWLIKSAMVCGFDTLLAGGQAYPVISKWAGTLRREFVDFTQTINPVVDPIATEVVGDDLSGVR